MIFNDAEIKRLAELAKIKIDDDEAAALRADLTKIAEHFGELGEVDTQEVEPMTGGVFHENSHRHDDEEMRVTTEKERLIGAFPQREGDFLRVPPVFENRQEEL